MSKVRVNSFKCFYGGGGGGGVVNCLNHTHTAPLKNPIFHTKLGSLEAGYFHLGVRENQVTGCEPFFSLAVMWIWIEPFICLLTDLDPGLHFIRIWIQGKLNGSFSKMVIINSVKLRKFYFILNDTNF